jgi:hypothetical protein
MFDSILIDFPSFPLVSSHQVDFQMRCRARLTVNEILREALVSCYYAGLPSNKIQFKGLCETQAHERRT